MKLTLLLLTLAAVLTGCKMTGGGYCRVDGRPFDFVEYTFATNTTGATFIIRKWECWDGVHAWGLGPHRYYTTNAVRGMR